MSFRNSAMYKKKNYKRKENVLEDLLHKTNRFYAQDGLQSERKM